MTLPRVVAEFHVDRYKFRIVQTASTAVVELQSGTDSMGNAQWRTVKYVVDEPAPYGDPIADALHVLCK